MKIITCKQCQKKTKKYEREGNLFCNRKCYTDWKRINPNKKAYKEKVFISGYYYLYKPKHPRAIKGGRYIAEHRWVLEQKIGRYLEKNEIIHHKNGIKNDNRIENLQIVLRNAHRGQIICPHCQKEFLIK